MHSRPSPSVLMTLPEYFATVLSRWLNSPLMSASATVSPSDS